MSLFERNAKFFQTDSFDNAMKRDTNYYTILLCVTHRCNLNCSYCYQQHDSMHEMSYETAISCIKKALAITECNSIVEFIFFGGEPLLRFDLMRDVVTYVNKNYMSRKIRFFASTNGTLLTDDMKRWFIDNKDTITLGLSLDGDRKSHNINRSNSFDAIDINFFKTTWPAQNVKMTVSTKTIGNYASDVEFLHSLGFGINGGTLCIDDECVSDDTLLIFAKQLFQLIDYYSSQTKAPYNALFDVDLVSCENEKKFVKKNCSVGDKLFFFDTNGEIYPCTFMTPMTFNKQDMERINKTNFTQSDAFIDEDCYNHCYLFPICKICPAENYLHNNSFKKWNRKRCALTQLIALVVAEVETKKILRNPQVYDNSRLFYTIEAIKKIRGLYQKQYELWFHCNQERTE